MYGVGPEKFPLCLDCYIRWHNAMLEEGDELARQYNHAANRMDAVTGNYGLTPRMPVRERRFIIQTGGVTLNNIHVSNSEIGVLNTGTIENVDSTVTVLKSEGSTALAAAVTMLSEAVIKSAEVNAEQKNQILELLGTLSQEAVAPKEKRKLSVARTLLTELSGILSGVSTLAQVWQKVEPLFRQAFGF